MTFSLVITTYNRERVLEKLLIQLEEQTDRDFEVIVAMDGCTDGTLAMLERSQPSYPLRWLDTGCGGYGLALARNAGILSAREGAVTIIDDDSVPVPGFVAAHRASVRPGVITGGPRDPSDPVAAPRMAWKMAELRRLSPMIPMTITQIRREHPTAYLIENNTCMLRDDWIAMGLFSERLKMYGFIGQEFFARAEYLGLRYQFNPDAAVIHRGEVEGDNGFRRSRKNRQLMLATLVRPSLMMPTHYRAQIAWANAISKGGVATEMPPYLLHAAIASPYRLLRAGLSGAIRRAKASLRRLPK